MILRACWYMIMRKPYSWVMVMISVWVVKKGSVYGGSSLYRVRRRFVTKQGFSDVLDNGYI